MTATIVETPDGGALVATGLGKITNNLYHDSAAQASRARRYLLRDELHTLSSLVKTVQAPESEWDDSTPVVTFPGRIGTCGRRRISKDANVSAKINESGTAHLSGLQLCGSVWACPVCQAKIRHTRGQDLEAGLVSYMDSKNLKDGENIGAFISGTVSHHAGQNLSDTLRTITEAFTQLLATPAYSGRKRSRTYNAKETGKIWSLLSMIERKGYELLERNEYVRVAADGKTTNVVQIKWFEPGEKHRLDIVGPVRSIEVTIGRNGWHPHFHCLLVTSRPLKNNELKALKAQWFARWQRAVEARGYTANFRNGIDVRPLDRTNLGQYISKTDDRAEKVRSVVLDLTRSDLKEGRLGSRTPLQVLQDCVDAARMDAEDGLTHALDANGKALDAGTMAKRCKAPRCPHTVCKDARLWWEYERATKGHRMLTWGKGVKELLSVESEDDKTDEEIANQETEAETVIILDPVEWRVLCNTKGARARFLSIIENAAPEERSVAAATFLVGLCRENPKAVERAVLQSLAVDTLDDDERFDLLSALEALGVPGPKSQSDDSL